MKLSRQDTNDRLDALKKAQNEALQKLSEMGSKALVEALRDVIQDFNSRLTEQFGENFKQLNEAVGKLLSWQDRYRTFIDEITLRLVQIVNSMTAATASYTELVGKADTFSKISQDLSGLLAGLEVQKQQLAGSLKALADLLQAASGSLPQIEAKVMELTGQLSSAVRQTAQDVGRTVAENSLLLRTSAQEATKQIATGVAEQQKEISKALAENVLLIRNSIQGVSQDFTKVNQDFNKHITELSTKTKEQVAVLDAALAEELKKSLESLGRQLAALSEKFVSDYGPLTDKLRLLVDVGRR
jgi:iron uptake system EfeUOB component EfeO/EfeM